MTRLRYYFSCGQLWVNICIALTILIGASIPGYGQLNRKYTLPTHVSSESYLPGVIIVKTKSSSQARTSSIATESMVARIRAAVDAKQVNKMFPDHSNQIAGNQQAKFKTNPHNADADISNIYRIEIDESQDIVEAINHLLQYEDVEYAEPYFLMRPLYNPNDPEANSSSGAQKYLSVIKAYQAWDITKGDTSVVIGILDTGVELGHEDLDNIKYNYRDPINGKDDDNDGYLDNYLGWDMADQDNVPGADKDMHGTGVTGVAAAATDNGKGIAGAGFQSTYLPIKVFTSETNLFRNGYEAIVYAADHGCKVINLSWGSANSYSKFAQNIINYAVLVKDVVVVAAAGNSGKNEFYYPASYANVLSVTNSDITDKRNAAATYNYEVDLIAPGTGIYTTKNGDSYYAPGGTSYSSPLVAGAAAMARSKFPELKAQQVMERLRLSTDNIYNVGSNKNYLEMLGKGRLNMQRALQNLPSPALRLQQFTYNNGLGKYAFGGDTLTIITEIINFLKQSSPSAKVTLSSPSPYVTIIDSVFQINVLDTFAVVSNQMRPFRVHLKNDIPGAEKLVFRLGFEDENHLYKDYQYFSFEAASDYLQLDIDQSQVTVGSNGDVAYDPSQVSNFAGFNYLGQSIATRMGLAIGISKDSVSDNIITDFSNGKRSWNFNLLENIKLIKNTPFKVEARSVFTDEPAENPINLRIEQAILGGDGGTNNNFFVFDYRVVNLNQTDIKQLYTGFFADWDIQDPEKNKADWYAFQKLGYVYNTTGDQLFAGVALLTEQDSNYYAIDRININANIADIENTFVDSTKYIFMANAFKTQAGVRGDGNNIAHIVGAITDSLETKRGTHIAFAVVAGRSLEELQQAVINAKQAFTLYGEKPDVLATVKTCTDSIAFINPPNGENFRFYKDPTGAILLHEGSSFTTGSISKDSTIFVTNIDAGFEGKISQINIVVEEPLSEFSAFTNINHGYRNDTLYLDETNNTLLPWKDESVNAKVWKWNLGNGYTSILQNPKTRYEPGEYQISLITTSEPGCRDTLEKKLVVVNRGPKPVVPDANICEGQTVTLQAQNADNLLFYADSLKNTLIGKGKLFNTGEIKSDTSFYVVNIDSIYESLPKKVKISVNTVNFKPDFNIDTVNVNSKYTVQLQAAGSFPDNQSFVWYIDGKELLDHTQETKYNYAEKLITANPYFEIGLSSTVVDEKGLACGYTQSKLVHIGNSPSPVIKSREYCPGSQVELVPTGGSIFYFYKDPSLNQILHKGKKFVIDNFQNDTIIYITNVDSLKESDAVSASVFLYKFADFSMSDDTIRLSNSHEVTFEAYKTQLEEEQSITWQWDFGNGSKAYTQTSTQQFDTPGTFNIRLWAQNQKGCSNIIEKKLIVSRVTGLGKDFLDDQESTVIFPNPTQGIFTIQNQDWQYKDLIISLFNIQGKLLFATDISYKNMPVRIDTKKFMNKSLDAGVYFLKIESEGQILMKKLLIN